VISIYITAFTLPGSLQLNNNFELEDTTGFASLVLKIHRK